jgi:hypothetical protein
MQTPRAKDYPASVPSPEDWPADWTGFDFELGKVTVRPAGEPQWEVVYLLEPVKSETVIRSITVRPVGDGVVPPDGLPARTARDLIRPGAALAFHRAALALEVWWATSGLPWFAQKLAGASESDEDDPTTHRAKKITRALEAKWPDMPRNAEMWEGYIASMLALGAEWQHVPSVPRDRLQRLARTAQLYVEAREYGHRAPIRRVADLQERNPASVRDDIHEARLEGLLTPSRGHGHAGGQLTRRAINVLQEATP